MTILELNKLLLLGLLCGSIQATSPLASHSVYNQWDELNLKLEISCIEMRRRDKYIQAYKGKLP